MTRKYNLILSAALLMALISAVAGFAPASADVAPPESPPGVAISPDKEGTQVRMVSENVTLALLPGEGSPAKAATKADFVMRNLGTVDEAIQVRFPLTFGEALNNGGTYPPINDFTVNVDGVQVKTDIVNTTDANSGATIPWATFPVKFPIGKDVKIEAGYTTQGFGYDPQVSFRYILETGAGWKSTIGAGDITVKLPYVASEQNVVVDGSSGFAQTAGMPSFSGNEAHWHFENLEPTANDNFEVSIVSPSLWSAVLKERQASEAAPTDGETWGQLGKAIKTAIRNPKGFLREDSGGEELFLEADSAYGKAVAILPNDSQWHYGYADLLWSHYLFSIYYKGLQNYSEITKLAIEVQTALKLNPDYQEAKDLATMIAGTIPWAINQTDNGFTYSILTATPTYLPPTPTGTNTPIPAQINNTELPTLTAQSTATVKAGSTPIPPVPAPKNTFCSSIFVFPILLGLLWLFTRKR